MAGGLTSSADGQKGVEMSKHTPGPWQLHSPTEGDPITGDGSYCITGPDGGVIADIVPKDWHETPGNARLIASAPEMLEALEAVVAEVLAGVDVTLPTSVIAKARGEMRASLNY
jgi:hypothetical protein